MKREGFRHPKTLTLASSLGIPIPHAIGILELLWDYTAEYAPQGNVGKFSNSAIAMACQWTGNPDDLVAALDSSGWIDKCLVHRYVIHDLADHAQAWWCAKMAKLNLPFLRAVTSITTATAASPARAEAVEPPVWVTPDGYDESPDVVSTYGNCDQQASSQVAPRTVSETSQKPLHNRIPDNRSTARYYGNRISNQLSNNTGKPVTGVRSSGVFGNVSLDILRDNTRLLSWIKRAQIAGVVDSCEQAVLDVFCAAERALAKGDNPCAFFVKIVRDKLWNHITQENEDNAAWRLREVRLGKPTYSLKAERTRRDDDDATEGYGYE